jgi:hypothetical protein
MIVNDLGNFFDGSEFITILETFFKSTKPSLVRRDTFFSVKDMSQLSLTGILI